MVNYDKIRWLTNQPDGDPTPPCVPRLTPPVAWDLLPPELTMWRLTLAWTEVQRRSLDISTAQCASTCPAVQGRGSVGRKEPPSERLERSVQG
ncbi:hypothetical protein [uncultured Thermanaerothrix sp.]|uniref:hypothetical protein n=1 Tax=uncultured Thermanaerothrix sp. TaxID=1195149 RepID=UPI002604897D|nr:hypothetical protein [uncultured Thermanaerothrix sp.]